MDEVREQERLTYRLCRLGFGILSLALLVACASTLLTLPRIFGGRGFLPWLFNASWWPWVDVPIVWGSLAGAYLLWGRWDDRDWQRRSGLLVLMCVVDAVLWLIEHGGDLGLRTGDFGHDWLRRNLGEALGWAEFALLASLACEVMVHLGVAPASETGRATRSLAATGAAVYMLLFWLTTDWEKGWPLEFKRPGFIEVVLLELGSTMIWTITLIQVTALNVAAFRQCGAVLDDMDREDDENDPLRPSWKKVGGPDDEV
jgi:hypothetical protein